MIVGAEAGLLHVTGQKGGGPVRPGLSLIDLSTGLYMQGAIMGALYARDRTGVGQKLDGSLFETQVALLANVGLSWLNLGIEAKRWGTQHPSVVPYDAFQASDGYFVGGALNDKQFVKLAKILGKPELVEDPRFSTNSERVKHRDECTSIVNELFGAKTITEWMEAFEGSGMPYGGVNTMERVFNHPQAKARDMVVEIEHEAAQKGTMNLIGMKKHSR
jgi:succinate--hydroxymethylglutarate CoA-transferase